MKLTIDTKHDTHDDIRKVLHILTHLLQQKEGTVGLSPERPAELSSTTDLASETSSSSATEPADSSNLMSMFASPGDAQKSEISGTAFSGKKEDTAPDFSGFMNLVNKKEDEDKKEPKLEFF